MYDIDFLILKRFYNDNKEATYTKEEFRKIFDKVGSEFNEHQRESMEDRIDSLCGVDKYLEVLEDTQYCITKRGRLQYEDELKKRNAQEKRDKLQGDLLSTSVKSNILSPLFAGLAVILALVTIVKDCKRPNENIAPILQQIDTPLQQQRILLDSLQQHTKGVQTELHRLADSLTK